MLATYAAVGFDTRRPAIVRIHEVPTEVIESQLHVAPAMSFFQQVTAQEALEALRQMPPDIDDIYYLFVTDAGGHLVGMVSLRQLITAPPGARLFEFMNRLVTTLPYNASLEEQLHLACKSGLLALPVVDEQGKLVGAMDMSDLMNAIEQRMNRDLSHLAGISRHEQPERPLFATARDRLLWLVANLLPVFLVAAVVSLFSSVLASVAMLAAFLPVVGSLSSRAGIQTLGLTMRSLALGDINATSAKQMLSREVMVGLINGVFIGILAGTIGWLWQGSTVLGMLVCLVMLLNLPVAALTGLLVPLACRWLKLDPSLGSTTLVTMLTDVCGFALLLGMGALLLQMGYL